MGIKDEFGYVRVTSALRRFSDLLGRWQLRSAFLKGGRARPAFNQTEVQQMIATMNGITKRRGKIDRHADARGASHLFHAQHHALAFIVPSPPDKLAEEAHASLTVVALRATLHSVGCGR